MNYPNMVAEILDAIHLMYEDYPDVEADCYLCLSDIKFNQDMAMRFSIGAQVALEKMKRCPSCGNVLKIHRYNLSHPELDGCPVEEMAEFYCPNCDIVGEKID